MNFLAKQTHRANLWLLGREGIVRKFGITALLISYMCVLLARLCPALQVHWKKIRKPNVVGFLLCSRYAAAAKSLQSCPILRPHRQQPIRLPQPWDFPGKNTGVGCHFLLQYVKVKSESKVTQSCPTPSDPMDCSLPGSSVHGIFLERVLEWGAIAFSGARYVIA